jgi:sugar diacid utilization regulator
MTANSPSSVTESASNTIDPDAQERRANDDGLGAGFEADLAIDDDMVDGLFTAEEFAAEFDVSHGDARLFAEYRRLAVEQAGLRRVTALVARGVELLEVCGAVAEEIRRCAPAVTAELWRFDTQGEVTVVAAAADPAVLARRSVGMRTPVEANTLAALVQRSARPARIEGYQNIASSIGARVREVNVRAAVGVPIIVDGRVWGLAAVGLVRPGLMPADAEVRLSGFTELIAAAVRASDRDEHNRQLLAQASRCSTLIENLLEGRVFDGWSLREVARRLRLPICGPYVVVAAQAPGGEEQPLPEIESKLRSLDISSVWRLLPDVQAGIVHVLSDRQLDLVVALLARMTSARVGVSAVFEDLRETPPALHVAKMMLRGPTDSTSSVAVFDGSILATAVVSAPAAMIKTVGAALRCFSDLPVEDREILFDTFRAWQDSDASMRAAAEVLFCHPNTVRYRLRRIEKCTGRSLSRPKDVAELCLAFEVHRRLM